jgi:hypothetical protein
MSARGQDESAAMFARSVSSLIRNRDLGRISWLAGSVALGALTIFLDTTTPPSLTLSPLGTLAVLGVTVFGGRMWGVVAALTLAAAFAVTLGSPGGSATQVFVQAAVISVGYLLAIVLVEMARRQGIAITRLNDERSAAKDLHDVLLANDLNTSNAWQLEVAHVPLGDLGGDFYDIIPHGHFVDIIVADIMGKGLRAAMLLSALKLLVQVERSPSCSTVLARLNRYLAADASGETFCTAWYGRLGSDGSLRYSIAGHEPAVVRHANGETRLLETGGLPLGVDAETIFPEFETTLHAGDAVAIYTDGLSDLFDKGLPDDIVFAGATILEAAVNARNRRDDVLAVIATRRPPVESNVPARGYGVEPAGTLKSNSLWALSLKSAWRSASERPISSQQRRASSGSQHG